MKLAVLFSLYAVLATAAVVSDTGKTHKGRSSKSHSTNGPKGVGGVIFLDGPCLKDSQCAGGKKGRCGNIAEYLKVVPEGPENGVKELSACAYSKKLTGPPDDAACTYLNDCSNFGPLPGHGIPNAIVDDAGDELCLCPAKVSEARAGFAMNPPPEIKCS
ncbi:hypothetical protein IWX90DRAFT_491340 [Phyllosticta citrichinensis]|uniref:Uncharacterized protein n=1 Tax=Phyllosticta citrichinensis TaxID=1130410 RepID=A0ABR1Y565_9PEZI